MVTVNKGTTELDFGVEVTFISRQSPSLFLLFTTVDGSTLIQYFSPYMISYITYII